MAVVFVESGRAVGLLGGGRRLVFAQIRFARVDRMALLSQAPRLEMGWIYWIG